MKMHVLYADSLAFDSNPTEAILVLKSLAKVFPPLPFAEIPFTKTLKRSKNLEDLNNASGKSLETSKSYSYTNYRNTQANILNEDYFESYLGKSQNTDFNEKKSKRYPLKVPQLGTDGFLICSNVKFLYKIAKIAVKYHENIEDGLCAIEDYLMMLKFNQHKNKKKVQTAKALYLKGFLLVESLNLMQGIQVMEEALPELDRLGQTTKTEKIRAFLSQNS